jgi:hypothetical protein
MDKPDVEWPIPYHAVSRLSYDDNYRSVANFFPTQFGSRFNKLVPLCQPTVINTDESFKKLFAPRIVRLFSAYIKALKLIFKPKFILRILSVPSTVSKFDCVMIPQLLRYRVDKKNKNILVNHVIDRQGTPITAILAIREVYDTNSILDFVYISCDGDFIDNLNKAIRKIGNTLSTATLLLSYNKFEVDWEEALRYLLSAKAKTAEEKHEEASFIHEEIARLRKLVGAPRVSDPVSNQLEDEYSLGFPLSNDSLDKLNDPVGFGEVSVPLAYQTADVNEILRLRKLIGTENVTITDKSDKLS